MVICPKCKKNISSKLIMDQISNNGTYHIHEMTCENCGAKVKAYYKDNKLDHIIPKRVIRKIIHEHSSFLDKNCLILKIFCRE